jgi:hypothetical protein
LACLCDAPFCGTKTGAWCLVIIPTDIKEGDDLEKVIPFFILQKGSFYI